MFRFVIIANQVGLVQFSHYFEAVPDSLKIKLEREAIEKCLNRTGEKEGKIHSHNGAIMFRREALLIVLIVAHVSTAENSAQEFMHSFVQVLFHHLKITTEKSTLHNKEILHRVLEQMVHGNMLETRISHITALRDFVS